MLHAIIMSKRNPNMFRKYRASECEEFNNQLKQLALQFVNLTWIKDLNRKAHTI